MLFIFNSSLTIGTSFPIDQTSIKLTIGLPKEVDPYTHTRVHKTFIASVRNSLIGFNSMATTHIS